MRRVKITGTGSYLPNKIITSQQLAEEIGVSREDIIAKSGVDNRHYANKDEKASVMGAKAAKAAVNDAGITLSDIDLIICGSGSMERPIPCTAALIHRELGLKNIPAFDVNATCLSFLTSLDLASYLISSGTYENILIVSTEIASCGLNKNNIEVAALFGDGAAAVVVSKSGCHEKSHILSSRMTTDSEGAELCTIPGGGSAYPPQHWTSESAHQFQFQMNGKEVFRLASKQLPEFVDALLTKNSLCMDDIDVLVPHQASKSSLRIISKKLNISKDKMVDIIEDHGNMIAASIPLALHCGIKSGLIQRGKRILLLGTSAGLSIGGMILIF